MIDLTQNKKQSEAWFNDLENPRYRRILYDGGARSGKTVLILTWLVKECEKHPGCRVLVARKNRNAAERSIWADTLTWILKGRAGWRARESDLMMCYQNGSYILVDGLDDQDRVDKILGTEYDHIFFNEATQLSWPTIQTVLSRLAHSAVPIRKALFDCNPKNRRHWLHRVGVEHVIPGSEPPTPLPDAKAWTRRHWTPYDNPFLPADAMLTLESLSGIQRRRLLKGEWCDNEGAVYDEFDEEIHVHKGPMPAGWQDWNRVRGIDFGYANPFVCLWGAIDHDGCLWIYREWYKSQMTCRAHAEIIKKQETGPFKWTVADHDAEDRATLQECGIFTIPAIKDVERGIQAVKDRLKVQGNGRPRVMICECCVETIGEFYDYSWGPAPTEKNAKEEPVKDRDHCLIAGTMITTRRGDVPIESVTTSDFVMTRSGWRQVLKSGRTGRNARVSWLIAENGATIIGTPEHKVWCESQQKFIMLQHLTQFDTLLAWTNQKQSCSTVSNSAATHNQNGGQTGCTSHPEYPSSSKVSEGSMKKYGRHQTGQSGKAFAYTTKTATNSTMSLKTLSVFQASITEPCTLPPLHPNAGMRFVPISFMQGLRLSHGTSLRLLFRFIDSTQKTFGRIAEASRLFVRRAVKSIGPLTSWRSVVSGFALTPASQNTGVDQELITLALPVNNAAENSQKTDTQSGVFVPVRVRAVIAFARTLDVYDLTVEGRHEFIANGILVHNSMDTVRYLVMQLQRHDPITPQLAERGGGSGFYFAVGDTTNNPIII